MGRSVGRIWKDNDGAVAPTVALSLVALIAAGGIAFDYARMASLDTELQQAADQAALAAASQLDGQSGACARASAAAVGLLSNQTLFGNDGGGTAVTITGEAPCDATGFIRFYQSYDQSTDSDGPAATSDANAKVVEVQVDARHAKFALTPIVAALRSADFSAEALASMGSAICKNPPVMICNPNEGGDPNFTVANYIGKGLKLVSVGNGGGAWTAGNFGYLNTNGGSNGAPGLREALGWVSPPGDCAEYDGVDTKPGASVSVTDAVNTRFDIYDSNTSCESGGTCPASINSVKDLVHPTDLTDNNACKIHNKGWQEVDASARYLPDYADALTKITTTPAAMGHPRDMCHAARSGAANYCTGPVGTGEWDADAYFRVNYVRTSAGAGGGVGTRWSSANWKANTGLDPTATRVIPGTSQPNPAYASRYNVYTWEIAHRGELIDGVRILDPRTAVTSPSQLNSYNKPVCSPLKSFGTGTVPGGTNVDRRRLSMAVVNCSTGDEGGPVNGSSTNVTVKKWMEFFFVEPSLNRGAVTVGTANARSDTGTGDIYVEVISETTSGGAGSTAGQVVRRDTPYLIR